MKTNFIFLSVVMALISSCTAYKNGQTPDNVYAAPTKPANSYANTQNNEDYYADRENYADDQYLRMMAMSQNRSRWSSINDFDYWYRPSYSNWGYGYGKYYPGGFYGNVGWSNGYNYDPYCGCYNPWNPWYGTGPVVVVTKYPVYVAPSNSPSSLRGYRNNSYDNTNRSYQNKSSYNKDNNYNNNNNNRYNTTTPTNSNNNTTSPTRTYNPSSNNNGSTNRQPKN